MSGEEDGKWVVTTGAASGRGPTATTPIVAPPLPFGDERWALFLDVDGTLITFAETPNGVHVPPSLPQQLAQVQAVLGGALAFVSGRSIEALDRLFAPYTFPAAGLHGVERRRPDGDVRRIETDQRALDEARRLLERYVAAHPAALLEDKGASLALHYRRDPSLAPSARAAAEDALAVMAEGFHVLPGHSVIELKSVAADKGRAIAAFLREAPFAGRRPVFVGDDATDEDGFELVRRHGGIGVLVGDPRGSAARHLLPDPPAVHRWLGDLYRQLA